MGNRKKIIVINAMYGGNREIDLFLVSDSDLKRDLPKLYAQMFDEKEGPIPFIEAQLTEEESELFNRCVIPSEELENDLYPLSCVTKVIQIDFLEYI